MGLIKKEGYLFKSPPEKKMKTQSSWHKRYFVLAEIGFDDKMKKHGTKHLDHNNNSNNNNNNNNNKIEDQGQKNNETTNHNNANTTEVYLMYWKELSCKQNRKKPKGKHLFSGSHDVVR